MKYDCYEFMNPEHPDIFPEPELSELVRHPDPNLTIELLPEHWERYVPFYELRKKERIEGRLKPATYIGRDPVPNCFRGVVAAAKAIKSIHAIPNQRKDDKPMTDTYTTKELAVKLDIPWQTVASWRRNGTISMSAIVPNSSLFKKPIIDRMIADGTLGALSAGEDAEPETKNAPPCY